MSHFSLDVSRMKFISAQWIEIALKSMDAGNMKYAKLICDQITYARIPILQKCKNPEVIQYILEKYSDSKLLSVLEQSKNNDVLQIITEKCDKEKIELFVKNNFQIMSPKMRDAFGDFMQKVYEEEISKIMKTGDLTILPDFMIDKFAVAVDLAKVATSECSICFTMCGTATECANKEKKHYHHVCNRCINKWLLHNPKQRCCPTCRSPLNFILIRVKPVKSRWKHIFK